MFHAADAGLFCSVPGHAIVTSSNWSVVGTQWVIIDSRRFVFQVEIHFCVDIDSICSKPTISVDVFDRFHNWLLKYFTDDRHSNDHRQFAFQIVT